MVTEWPNVPVFKAFGRIHWNAAKNREPTREHRREGVNDVHRPPPPFTVIHCRLGYYVPSNLPY
jgi:hypothetical protein